MSEDRGHTEVQVARHRSLLGRLAGKAGLGETFATDALAVMLEEPNIRSAFLDDIQVRFLRQGIELDLQRVAHFLPQVWDQTHGKPDIVGHDAQGDPILVIEAKFDHHLGREQVIKYLELQIRDVSAGKQFALVLLVPTYKLADAIDVGREAALQLGLDSSIVLTVSWPHMMDVVESAAAALGTGHRSHSADAAQLRDLVDYLTRTGLEPLASAVTVENWDANLPAFYSLVDKATRRVDEIRGTKRYPLQHPDPAGFGPFYYVSEPGVILYSLGPHRTFASHGLEALWLRFGWKPRQEQEALEPIRLRLASSGERRLRDDDGYVWVPIAIGDEWDDALLDRVVGQVLDVLEAGLPRSFTTDDVEPSS